MFGSSDFSVAAGTSFTIADNVIVKISGSDVGINYPGGNIFNHDGSGVYFTSYMDDTHGGDTNGDGNLTSPALGDWEGIYNTISHAYEVWDNILYD